MNDKLKELTDKLYGEGLEKGRMEAERMVSEAKVKASRIVADAQAQADNIIKKAETQAADIEKNSMTEIILAGKQAVAKIKNEIADAVIVKSIDKSLKDALVDAEFIETLLLEIAKNWRGDSANVELKVLLPECMDKELTKRFEASSAKLLDAGIEVGYSKDVRNGFKIGEKNGGFYIAFTDESFVALMHKYLREKVSKMLFE